MSHFPFQDAEESLRLTENARAVTGPANYVDGNSRPELRARSEAMLVCFGAKVE
ncbi:MAG: hypothetical protein ACYC06_03200 [Ilumatobacteraceae bacterium]